MNKYHLYFLREDEWELIKAVMRNYEETFEGDLTNEAILNFYNRINAFNHIAVDNIEDMTKTTDKFIMKGENDDQS